jgi:hypothetical protein
VSPTTSFVWWATILMEQKRDRLWPRAERETLGLGGQCAELRCMESVSEVVPTVRENMMG